MIRALKQPSKEIRLAKQVRSTRKQKIINFFSFIFLVGYLSACSSQPIKSEEIEWNYPPDNPYPRVMETVKYSDQGIALRVELKPETINVSCRLRNDSPYYWCDFEGDLKHPSSKLPQRITTTFHRVVNIKGKRNAVGFIKRLEKGKMSVFAILKNRPFIADGDNSIYSQLFGIYNTKECIDLFHDYSLCPKTAKKLNLFSGKYIE